MQEVRATMRKDYEEMNRQGMYNPPYRVTVKDKHRTSFIIGAGTHDDVSVYKHQGLYVVLTVNSRLPYIGIETHEPITGEEVHNIFLQEDYAQEDALGKQWDHLTHNYLARILFNRYCMD